MNKWIIKLLEIKENKSYHGFNVCYAWTTDWQKDIQKDRYDQYYRFEDFSEYSVTIRRLGMGTWGEKHKDGDSGGGDGKR